MLHGDILGQRARISPDEPALVVVASGERLTYRELDAGATRCGQIWRRELGLEKGDRCAILAENRREYLEAFFACGKTGVILVPLNTRLAARELTQILEDSGARALMYSDASAGVAAELRGVAALERLVALDDPTNDGDLDYGRLPATYPDLPPAACAPDDIHCLLYTSGTTGKPKGVMVPQRQIAWNGYNTAINWQLRADDVSPVFVPLFHAGGLGAFLVPILTAGGTIVLHDRFDPAEVLSTIERERCTVVLGVPTIFKMLLETPELERTSLEHVRWFISGGAPLPVELVEAYHARGVVLRQGYGLTEVGPNCFAMSSSEALSKRGSIGRPLMFAGASVRGPEGRELPPGEVGELWLRGPHVSLGYWHNPDATRAVYDAEGWFHTGDLARRDAEGFFYISGRAKDMFISGGENVYPVEVENALLQHPHVRDAAVIGVPDPKWGEVGIAFLEGNGVRVAGEDLTAFLEKRLARYKIPRRFLFVESLPRTAYGKVKKGDLLALYSPV
jgi:fatty-acyl-CoA synthase